MVAAKNTNEEWALTAIPFIKNKHTEKKLIKWLEKMENDYENKQYIKRKTSRKRLHNL